jgi:hypothetical protein
METITKMFIASSCKNKVDSILSMTSRSYGILLTFSVKGVGYGNMVWMNKAFRIRTSHGTLLV